MCYESVLRWIKIPLCSFKGEKEKSSHSLAWIPNTCDSLAHAELWAVRVGSTGPFTGVSLFRASPDALLRAASAEGKKKWILDCHFRMQFNEMNSISSCLASPDILPSIPYIDILMECELWAPKERQFVLCSRTCQAIITAWVIHQNDRKWLGISRGTNQAVCLIPLVLVSDTNKITPFLSKLRIESLRDGKKKF